MSKIISLDEEIASSTEDHGVPYLLP